MPEEFTDKLTLIPDPRKTRENERRIEEFVRKMVAAQQTENSSYARRFLVMD